MVVGPPALEIDGEETTGLSAKPPLGLGLQPFLAFALLGLELLDLRLDRAVELLALGQLLLDVETPVSPLRNDLLLLPTRLAEPRDLGSVGGAGVADILEDAPVLARDAIGGIDPFEDLVERRGAEQNLDERVVAARLVERDDAVGKSLLRGRVGAAAMPSRCFVASMSCSIAESFTVAAL